MFLISKIFRAIVLMQLGVLGIIIKIAFMICYLGFLLYAFRRYNMGDAPFGEKAEDFKTPFVATAVVSAVFAILLDLRKGPIVVGILVVCEILLFIWSIAEVRKYDGISVIGNVIFWFLVAICAGQIVMIFVDAIIVAIILAALLFIVFIYVIANEIGSF